MLKAYLGISDRIVNSQKVQLCYQEVRFNLGEDILILCRMNSSLIVEQRSTSECVREKREEAGPSSWESEVKSGFSVQVQHGAGCLQLSCVSGQKLQGAGVENSSKAHKRDGCLHAGL